MRRTRNVQKQMDRILYDSEVGQGQGIFCGHDGNGDDVERRTMGGTIASSNPTYTGNLNTTKQKNTSNSNSSTKNNNMNNNNNNIADQNDGHLSFDHDDHAINGDEGNEGPRSGSDSVQAYTIHPYTSTSIANNHNNNNNQSSSNNTNMNSSGNSGNNTGSTGNSTGSSGGMFRRVLPLSSPKRTTHTSTRSSSSSINSNTNVNNKDNKQIVVLDNDMHGDTGEVDMHGGEKTPILPKSSNNSSKSVYSNAKHNASGMDVSLEGDVDFEIVGHTTSTNTNSTTNNPNNPHNPHNPNSRNRNNRNSGNNGGGGYALPPESDPANSIQFAQTDSMEVTKLYYQNIQSHNNSISSAGTTGNKTTLGNHMGMGTTVGVVGRFGRVGNDRTRHSLPQPLPLPIPQSTSTSDTVQSKAQPKPLPKTQKKKPVNKGKNKKPAVSAVSDSKEDAVIDIDVDEVDEDMEVDVKKHEKKRGPVQLKFAFDTQHPQHQQQRKSFNTSNQAALKESGILDSDGNDVDGANEEGEMDIISSSTTLTSISNNSMSLSNAASTSSLNVNLNARGTNGFVMRRPNDSEDEDDKKPVTTGKKRKLARRPSNTVPATSTTSAKRKSTSSVKGKRKSKGEDYEDDLFEEEEDAVVVDGEEFTKVPPPSTSTTSKQTAKQTLDKILKVLQENKLIDGLSAEVTSSGSTAFRLQTITWPDGCAPMVYSARNKVVELAFFFERFCIIYDKKEPAFFFERVHNLFATVNEKNIEVHFEARSGLAIEGAGDKFSRSAEGIKWPAQIVLYFDKNFADDTARAKIQAVGDAMGGLKIPIQRSTRDNHFASLSIRPPQRIVTRMRNRSGEVSTSSFYQNAQSGSTYRVGEDDDDFQPAPRRTSIIPRNGGMSRYFSADTGDSQFSDMADPVGPSTSRRLSSLKPRPIYSKRQPDPPITIEIGSSEPEDEASASTTNTTAVQRRIRTRNFNPFADGSQMLFSYPFVGINCITIIVDDMNRLDEGQFLNDSIIDFYLRYILIEDRSLRGVDKTFVYSSFFYRKLTTRSTHHPVPFDRVKKWTSKVDVFTLDFLIIPINEHAHWYLAIILFPGRLLDAADKMSVGEVPVDDAIVLDSEQDHVESGSPKLDTTTYVIICDSLGQSRPGAIRHLKEYLVALVKDRKPDADVQLLKQSIKGMRANLPQQPNYCDCGVYILQYVEHFLKDPYLFAPKLIERSKELEEWFKPRDISNKRMIIRSLFDHLHGEWGTNFSLIQQQRDEARKQALEAGITEEELDEKSTSDEDIVVHHRQEVEMEGDGVRYQQIGDISIEHDDANETEQMDVELPLAPFSNSRTISNSSSSSIEGITVRTSLSNNLVSPGNVNNSFVYHQLPSHHHNNHNSTEPETDMDIMDTLVDPKAGNNPIEILDSATTTTGSRSPMRTVKKLFGYGMKALNAITGNSNDDEPQ